MTASPLTVGAGVDLLALTAELVDVASPSREEAPLVDLLEDRLRAAAHLEVTRVGDNLVARTRLGRRWRLALAGHTDTVPANGNDVARLVGDRLSGVGSADMKGGLAVMLQLALEVSEPAVDCTYVFYAREEVGSAESGLGELFDRRPDLLEADAALLGEPTEGALEAGCQGTMRLRVTLRGARAHTARPWMGRNAIHRLAGLLGDLEAYVERRPVIDGCEFREALQAVSVQAGVAGNVVPDQAELVVNHRFAPDRSAEEAEAHVREVLGPWLTDGDTVERTECASGAAPSHTHPLIATLVERNDLAVRAKLGWTDVARFAARGVPAANFGPGDSTVAHTQGEYLDRRHLDAVWTATHDLVTRGPDVA
ncbi:succinyl-diaminopimelate desuccinylase [Rhabdothermincola salaria]|uniref:succinyl-diaminopimelate desuccinylase n=1 Tax=Rhabdothermincola salaria TaxID=2903142 RepID=UPI001E2BFB9E|nr:succinyl-diaminopimelate desuccinylase [Rhabdothermincola salaria]MCD9624879.1 succinyl-diaminopimelate desuccinylase [Rhabdothermincola salaria]